MPEVVDRSTGEILTHPVLPLPRRPFDFMAAFDQIQRQAEVTKARRARYDDSKATTAELKKEWEESARELDLLITNLEEEKRLAERYAEAPKTDRERLVAAVAKVVDFGQYAELPGDMTWTEGGLEADAQELQHIADAILDEFGAVVVLQGRTVDQTLAEIELRQLEQ